MIDPDEVEDLRFEVRAERRAGRCVCDVGSWGTCPGPANCPNAHLNEDDEDGDD